jgi:hypothetical protein
MALKKIDKEFRHAPISYIDFKQLEMDRVLTSFLARLEHKGYHSRIIREDQNLMTTALFANEFEANPEWFEGFGGTNRDITERWIETHLMDMVNRGKPNQVIAAPRPLHGYTYRFRNAKHSRPYGADEQLYEMLSHARDGRGIEALSYLKKFFFTGIDPTTAQIEETSHIDVETQALLRLTDQVKQDAPDHRKPRESYAPLCLGASDLFADDVLQLLFYQNYIPRSVMVDYLKILFSFHLALYHLKLLKLLPTLLKPQTTNPVCNAQNCSIRPKLNGHSQRECPHQIGLVLDVQNHPGTPMARLAEQSADHWYRRIPNFVKTYFTIRKLDEFGKDQQRNHKISPNNKNLTINEVLGLLNNGQNNDLETFFKARLINIVDTSIETEPPLEIRQILEMPLNNFEKYIEILLTYRGTYHRGFVVRCLDSLMLKNKPGALLAQPRASTGVRRFVLDSRLLEVLLQIAVLHPGGERGYYTQPLRIEELIAFLQQRYGLYIDQLPTEEGFREPSIEDRAALRSNVTAFTTRLRELGFYQDLSDAYITQTVTPRYEILRGDL